MAGSLFALTKAIASTRHIYGKIAPLLGDSHAFPKQPNRFPRRAAICVVFVAATISLGLQRAGAQDTAQGKVLRVAIKPIAPFVFKQGTEPTGFSIDLWNALAQSLKANTAWVEVTTVGDQLQFVKSGKADVAIAAITITKEREDIVDFTQPYFD